MTSGPASRVLAAFCALAAKWLNEGPAKNPWHVTCRVHGGRFNPKELERYSVKAPAVLAGYLGAASATDDGDATALDLRMAAVVLAGDTSGPAGEPRDAMARRLADRLCFELGRLQVADDGRESWPHALFSADELEAGRGRDIGDPREIRAENLYGVLIDSQNFAAWVVVWMQRFRAKAQDFDLPLPAPAGFPDTVLAGYAPDVGRGHEGDYEQAVPEGGA